MPAHLVKLTEIRSACLLDDDVPLRGGFEMRTHGGFDTQLSGGVGANAQSTVR